MTKASRLATALLALAACADPRPRPHGEGGVVLTLEGASEGEAPEGYGPRDLARVPRAEVAGRAPGDAADARWEGPSLSALLGDVDPERRADLVLVHGAGGFVAAIPWPAVRQYRPVLAERVNGAPLAGAKPAAAPFLLAWPSATAPGLPSDPRARWWWVAGVRKVELASWYGTWGRALRVPAGSTDLARRGSERFATQCIHCHQIRGAGGTAGPDLTRTLEGGRDQALGDALRRHAARDPRLAGIDAGLAGPELAAFLRAIAEAGPLPDEDAPKPPEPPREPARPPGPFGPMSRPAR